MSEAEETFNLFDVPLSLDGERIDETKMQMLANGEVPDSTEMFTASLMDAISGGAPAEEIDPGVVWHTPDGNFQQTASEGFPALKSTGGVEAAAVALMNVRDQLIEAFASTGADQHGVKTAFVDSIHYVEESLDDMGVPVEESFNPLSVASGLGQGNLLKNAEVVVQNTQDNYSLHNIDAIEARDREGRPAIAVRINGTDQDRPFTVVGAIVAKEDFTGNEAIDYVCQDGQGLFSVKANVCGQWKNVSDQFEIGADFQWNE